MAGDGATDDQPPAKGKVEAYVVCWVLGIGCLLPWNSMLTVQDYYACIFPNYHSSRVLTLVYQPFALILVGAFVYFEDKVNTRVRLLSGYALFVVCTSIIPIMDLLISRHGIGSFVGICIMSIGFGIATAHVQGGMIGELSYMQPSFVQAFIAGTAASGVATSALRIITKASFPNTKDGLRNGALAFFLIAAIFEILCLALYAFVFPRLEIVKYYHTTISRCCFIEEGATESKKQTRLSNTKIFVGVWDYAIDLFSICALTLSIFPGFLAEDTGNHKLGTWYVVLLVTAFNSGDFISRYLPFINFVKLTSRVGLFCASMLRLLFIPIFYFASKYGNQSWMLLLCFILGLSNGYLIVCILMEAPKGYKEAEQNALGNILTFFLILGIFFGVILDWLWLIGKGW